MKKLCVLALAAVASGSAGGVLAGPKDNVIDHIAEVMAVDSLCSRLKSNDLLIAASANFWGIRPEDIAAGGTYHDRLVGLIREKKAEISDHDEGVICAVGDLLYGADGMNVKNMLVAE